MKHSRLLALCAGGLLVLTTACARREEAAATKEAPAVSAPVANMFAPAKGTANIIGKSKFGGTVAPSTQIKMNADPVCMSLHKEPVLSDELIILEGNLVNVFVYVKEGLEKYSFAAPKEPVTLGQDGCRYTPHVGGIMVNQDLSIVNNDPTVHNVRCVAEKNPQFNLGMPIKGMESVRRFSTPEVMIRFKCDVHKWMISYFGILPHPYYSITGKDGAFALKNLPPGEYMIEAWHEKLGTQTQKITVGDKETKEVNWRFKAS